MPHKPTHLTPVERLNCVGQPFGYELATRLNFDVPLRLTKQQRIMVASLRNSLNQLAVSDKPSDQDVVREIVALYETNDLWALRMEREDLRASRNIVTWLGHTSLRKVAQFAVWNTERFDLLQNHLTRDHDAITNDTLQKTQRLVDLEFFPTIALPHVKQAIGAYGVLRAMDSFEAGARQANGYCTPQVIAIANNYMLPDSMEGISSDMESTVFHEYIHGAGMQGGAGFIHGIATKGTVHRWLEESFIEHATQVARDRLQPDPTVIHPDKRRIISSSAVYSQERTALATLTSKKAANIPIDLLAAAFFSPFESRERREVEDRLNSFLSRTLPDNDGSGLYTFSKQYETDHREGVPARTLTKLLNVIGDYSDEDLSDNSCKSPAHSLAYVSINELMDYSTR